MGYRMKRSAMSFLTTLLLIATCAIAAAAEITITPDHADGCYAAGEPVTWTIKGGAADAALPYTVQAEGLTEVAKGKLSFAGGAAKLSAKLDHPGALLLT